MAVLCIVQANVSVSNIFMKIIITVPILNHNSKS